MSLDCYILIIQPGWRLNKFLPANSFQLEEHIGYKSLVNILLGNTATT